LVSHTPAEAAVAERATKDKAASNFLITYLLKGERDFRKKLFSCKKLASLNEIQNLEGVLL
jgi:hypothetical protein